MNQDSNVPVKKVQAVGWAGAATTLILAVMTLLGINIPEDMVNEAIIAISALVSIVTFLAGYFKKNTAEEK
jgi:hypothetical protein